MKLTKHFGRIVQQISAKTDLPIIISEFYGGSDETDAQFTAANHASCYYHATINGAAVGLIWNPEEGEIDNYLFTDTQSPDGGQPAPHYAVVKAVNDYFSEGTQLYQTTTSAENVEAMASAEKTMVINKTENDITVRVNGKAVELTKYEVRVIDTPLQTDVRDFEGTEDPVIKLSYMNARPLLQIYTPVRTAINIRIYDLLGRKIKEESMSLNARTGNTINLLHDTIHHAAGIYFVAIRGLRKITVIRFLLIK